MTHVPRVVLQGAPEVAAAKRERENADPPAEDDSPTPSAPRGPVDGDDSGVQEKECNAVLEAMEAHAGASEQEERIASHSHASSCQPSTVPGKAACLLFCASA